MARIKSPLNSLFLILIICSLTCEIDSFPVLNSCGQKPTNPVCAVNGRTFRNQCCLDLFNRNGAKRGFYLAKARNGPCNKQRGPYRSGLEFQEVYNNNGYYPNEMPGNTVAGTEFKAGGNQVAVGHDKYNIGPQNSVYNIKSQNSGPPVYGSGFHGGPTDQYQAVQQQKPKPSYNNNYGQDQGQDQRMKPYQAPYNNLLNEVVHHAGPIISTSNNGKGPIYSYNYGAMEATTTPGIIPSPQLITTTASPLTTPTPLCPATNPAPVTFPTPVFTTVPPLTTPTEVPTTI